VGIGVTFFVQLLVNNIITVIIDYKITKCLKFYTMSANGFGNIFRLTSFGESHGAAIGGIIEGLPAGYEVNIEDIQQELDKRKPGNSKYVSSRNEEDKVEILSGVFEGRSLGTPLGFLVRNKDSKPKDYNHLKNVYRPSHADLSWQLKYDLRDYRGGGRSSARETVSRVVAGAIANLILKKQNIGIYSYVHSIGSVETKLDYSELDLELIDDSILFCPDKSAEAEMMELIDQTKSEGDSLGGEIICVIKNCPVGLGEPVFDKIEAELAKAMLSINAVKGFEIGSGFNSTKMKGSEHNDKFVSRNGRFETETNFSGGVQGGITNGMDIYFKVAFKPVATIMKDQLTVDNEGNEIVIEGKGRHDVTVVPRAVAIVKAMAAMVIADMILRNKNAKI